MSAMSEELTVYVATDRFATMSDDGTVRIWQIGSDGLPEVKEGPGWFAGWNGGRSSFVLVEEDLEFVPFNVKGDPVHHGPRGMKVTHLPTGFAVIFVTAKSQLENKSHALRELTQRVKDSGWTANA